MCALVTGVQTCALPILRFHPVEILLSMGIKIGVVAALGPPAAAVLVFEVLLNATSMFNHANLPLPLGLDRVLRWLVVTPDMHRAHPDRKSVVSGQSVSVRVDLGGRLSIKKQNMV